MRKSIFIEQSASQSAAHSRIPSIDEDRADLRALPMLAEEQRRYGCSKYFVIAAVGAAHLKWTHYLPRADQQCQSTPLRTLNIPPRIRKRRAATSQIHNHSTCRSAPSAILKH